MALKARITAVEYTVQGEDENGNPITIDLSRRGRFSVSAEYFDDTNPTNILHTQKFEFPSTVTVSDAQAAVVAEGQKVRDARTRVNQLQTNVGAIIAIP